MLRSRPAALSVIGRMIEKPAPTQANQRSLSWQLEPVNQLPYDQNQQDYGQEGKHQV